MCDCAEVQRETVAVTVTEALLSELFSVRDRSSLLF
jgi:hypothetical protein